MLKAGDFAIVSMGRSQKERVEILEVAQIKPDPALARMFPGRELPTLKFRVRFPLGTEARMAADLFEEEVRERIREQKGSIEAEEVRERIREQKGSIEAEEVREQIREQKGSIEAEEVREQIREQKGSIEAEEVREQIREQKGSIEIKVVKGRRYRYLRYREDGKQKSKYLGKVEDDG
jgi:hypothetical protein